MYSLIINVSNIIFMNKSTPPIEDTKRDNVQFIFLCGRENRILM